MATTGSALTGPNSLQTVPLEILNDIFRYACHESLDLTLLRVSRGIQWKLRGHPIVKILCTFCARQEFFHLFGFFLEAETSCEGIESSACVESFIEPGNMFPPAVFQRSWCTPGLITWMQLVLIKRTIMGYWIPLLERDGCQGHVISCCVLRTLLDDIVQKKWNTGEDNTEDELVVMDSSSRYSWTRLHVWPQLGRIVIRDQLSNTTLETKISLLSQISSR